MKIRNNVHKAFNIIMKILERLYDFPRQPNGMEERLSVRASWAFLGI